MKKISTTIISLIVLMILSTSMTYAYWASFVLGDSQTDINTINIGQWDNTPAPPILGWDLNVWEDEGELDQTIPEGQLFTYDGVLYVSTISDYNPNSHGLPGHGNDLVWAITALHLNWISGVNYSENSVIVFENKYYVLKDGRGGQWNGHSPAETAPWGDAGYWLEIAPIPEESFTFIIGTNLRDYTSVPKSEMTFI